MARSSIAGAAPRRVFADRVRQVGTDAPWTWLAAGWRDLCRAPAASLAYGAIFVLAGLLLAWALLRANLAYLFVPLATGFMLVGPAATLGFYDISRRLERGERPSLAAALGAFRENPGPLLYMGLALLALFMLWLRLAQLVFALSFPSTVGPDLRSIIDASLFTPDGLVFLTISLGLGAVIAALVFAGGAFALPLLFDRRTGMVEAVAISWTAVEANLPAMAVWAAILIVLTAAGMAAGLVGLAVTLPLAGHATWHAYRAVIRQD